MKKRLLRVLSRHPSHRALREASLLLPKLTLIRLGSTTERTGYACEINSIQGVKNSSSKLLMKNCFMKAGVRTADWYTVNDSNRTHFVSPDGKGTNIEALPYPIVAKSHFGSRGEGNYLLNDRAALEQWMKGKTLSHYIFERFMKFAREYRLHVTEQGCFYTCRKMLRTDCPDEERWHRHEDNSVWITEENAQFDKPKSWASIEADCVKALKAVGLDVCSFDVKVTSNKNKDGKDVTENDWILLECNSASRFGTITAKKYIEIVPKIFEYKMKQ